MQFSKKFVCECRELSTYEKHVAAPIFRKNIVVTGELKQAEITICGLGFYELFVNGDRITKGRLAPYISNPDHMLYYDFYNLCPYLKEGDNVIGIMLGDGFLNAKSPVWDFDKNDFNSSPKLALHMQIEDVKGTGVFDAGDFKCKKGPVTFNDLRCGIFYDKRLEEKGWTEPGFIEDFCWHEPLNADLPRGVVKLCEVEPIVVTKELRPIKIYEGELLDDYTVPEDKKYILSYQSLPPERNGGWIYDFGENNAGIFRLKIKGTKGQRISIQCAEIEENGKVSYRNCNFYPDGYAQRDIYIVGSEEEEIYEPMFTYHGFRYLYVSGITEEQATEDLLTYLVMSSDLKELGSFYCSDDIANQIYAMARRSDCSNFYYFPTDCPHREKNGWTGDAVVSAEHMILTMNVEKSWTEWLRNIRCAQNEIGKVPCIIPTGTWGYGWGSGPAWDTVIFTLPYILYRYRGNTDVIYENAHAMMSYLEYISKQRNEKGLLELGLGDWLPVDKPASAYDAPLEFTDSVMTYDMCRMAVEMFEVAGMILNRQYAEQFGKELYEQIRREYVEPETLTIKSCCQSAQALGIYYDIFTEDEKSKAFEQLLSFIHDKEDKLDTGFLGLRVIFHVLSTYGESELAWKMITGKEFPAYGWYVEQGYTTLPEQFIKDESGSHNHHFFGDVVQWFMRYPAGLQVENYRTVKIKPSFLKELDYAKASHMLPSGDVSVSWKRSGENILLEVNYPTEVQCDIELAQEYRILQTQGNVHIVGYNK